MNYYCARTHLLFFLCLFFLQSAIYAQSNAKISISSNDITIKEALREVEKQSKMSVAYNQSKLNGDKHIRLNVINQPIAQALTAILAQTGFTYEVKDDYILIVPVKKQQEANKTVTGRVLDESGAPLPGATVVISGTTRGTIANNNGVFSLAVSKGDVLSFKFLGYITENIKVTDQNAYNVSLAPDAKGLEAVVVTALGIKRSQKALSYNVQEIKQGELTRVKDANFVNALTGKVAGVTINSSSSGVGGASKVVMRGTKSISQSSNALYVIDGVPMFNLGGEGSTEFGSNGSTEAIADINPEDVESISVLTGAAAAALYGSRAANGAIVVNTKKGASGRAQVTVSSNAEILSPFILPRFQNKYGTGDPTVEGGSLSKSWGPLLNDANYTGYSPRDNFFETGTVFTNAVSLSTGNDKNQTYFSAAEVNSAGMVPNNEYDRHNFTFRNTSSFLKDKMKLDLSGSYIIQKDQNMTNQGIYSNPLVSAYLFPRGDDFDMVRVFERYDAARKIHLQYWPQGEGDFRMQNPYWIAYRNLKNNSKKRYMLSSSLSYNVFEWLNVSGRVRIDNSENDYTEKLYSSTNETLAGKKGSYGITKTKDNQTYADLLVNINKKINDFSLTANIGASISDISSDGMRIGGPIREDGISNVFNVFNLDDVRKTNSQNGWSEQTQSVFASGELGWKSTFYLTVTGRNDWASQLANSSQTSFFYPSVGLSVILSELVKMPESVDYVKLRGSYSSVGLPYPRQLTSLTYSFNQTNKIWETKTHYPIGNLYPERTNSFETGLTTRLAGHFNLDMSFYVSNTFNQTFDPQISVSSGYSTLYVQTGHVRNSGLEAALGYSGKWNKFRWNSNVTFSLNRNKIVELVDDYIHPETGEVINKDRLDIGGLARARFILKKDGSMGDLYSIADLKKDNNKNIYVDANGDFQTLYNVEDIKLGSVFPKFNVAWKNDFSWKGFNMSAMFTARVGGVVYSATQASMDMYGVSGASASARDAGGVYINGGDRVSAQKWYTTIGSQSGVPQYYTYSASNVRLHEASIGYTIPKTKLKNIAEITISAVGRNIWMIYNKAPFDPESVATTGSYYQGIDYFMMPSARTIGFNIRANF